jgi:hypothetical protein
MPAFDSEDLHHVATLGGIIARNALEDIHGEHIPDDVMREINPIIRNAFYTALHAARAIGDSEHARRYVDYQLQHVPQYWEKPELLDGYTTSLKRSGEVAVAVPNRGNRPRGHAQ